MRQPVYDLKTLPVSSFTTIAGDWQGMSKTVPEMKDDAAVLLIIREEGRFNFISNRGVEVLLGTGILTIVDGMVAANGRHGIAILTFHTKAGVPLLVVQAALTDGHHYYLEMSRLTNRTGPP
jgi:hypothetical protein